ncbi:MAG: hypothetical protein K2M47_06370 [Clostridiales bacterium]|nr:hypothetical protein [Clostridiales bacterium]
MFGRKSRKLKKQNSLSIKVEQLLPDKVIDESKLVEIKDEIILARLNQAAPEIARVLSASSQAVGSVYQAVLPVASNIPPSRDTKKAFLGLFQKKSVGAISTASGALSTASSLVFGVVALIVGQKYMSDIAKGLNRLNDGIRRIDSFQQNEYKSKVEALITRISVILLHKTELQINADLCERTLIELSSIEGECAQLLGQANETLEGYSRVKIVDFKKYCDTVWEIQPWVESQNRLLAVLYYVSDLKYVLNRSRGQVSRDFCRSLFNIYFERTDNVRGALKAWHELETKTLKIDIVELKRKRGGVDAFFHAFSSIGKKKNKYRDLPDGLGELIREQIKDNAFDYYAFKEDPFDRDLEIYIRDGKVFMLASPADEDDGKPQDEQPEERVTA